MKRLSIIIGLCCLPLFMVSCSNKDEPNEPQYLPPVEEQEKPYVDCASIDIHVSAKAQTVEILTTTNAKWIAHSTSWGEEDEEWILNPRLLTDGEYMIVQFDILENKGNASRVGDVFLELQERETRWWYLKDAGMPGFTITQAAAEP
jgi:hypothetical protein